MTSHKLLHIFSKRSVQVKLVLALIVVLLAIGFWYFPWISDDINYRNNFRHNLIDGEPVRISEILDNFWLRCHYDNSRLANLTMLFLQFVPKIFHVLGSALASWLMLWYGLKLIGRRDSLAAAALWSFFAVVTLPWVDQMYVFDFQLNYLWDSAFALVLAYCAIYHKGKLWPLCVLAVFAGMWQEACTFPLFVGLGGLFVFYPAYRNKRIFFILLFLCLGLSWLYFSPGGQVYRGALWRPFGFRANMLALFAVLPAVQTVWAIIRSIRRRSCPPLLFFLTVGSVVSAFLMLYSEFGPRVGWWACICAALGIMYLIFERGYSLKKSRIIAVSATLLYLFTCVHLVAVDHHARFERIQYDKVIEAYRADNDAVIYIDMVMREKAPLICMQKPYFGIFSHYRTNNILSIFYTGSEEHQMRVVPIELKDYTGEGLEDVPSNVDLKLYKGYMVGRAIADCPLMILARVDYGYRQITMNVNIVPFKDKNGIDRAWYSLDSSTLESLIYPVPFGVEILNL